MVMATPSLIPKLLQEFSTQPHIRKALSTPNDIYSVLSFFFNVDYSNSTSIQTNLQQGACLQSMSPLWYNGGVEYDQLCQPFAETVRNVGSKTTTTREHSCHYYYYYWPLTSVDSYMAQIICCDQLSRNLFRGTPEAFAYDDTAVTLSHTLGEQFLSTATTKENSRNSIPGSSTIYPPYVSFMVTSLMHSEQLSDHDMAVRLLDASIEKWPHLEEYFTWVRSFEDDHLAIIQQFGRYPHRNKAKGRMSTEAERQWLTAVDKLPAWAKSQG